ncbi:MAG: hypothetical protein M1404_07930 [Acidobacteria bacterium]|nr:hypothetical protein [Acidobacteriota bacterium]
MMKKLSLQAKFALGILVIGGGALAAEYFVVKWYPYYRGAEAQKVLKLLPYQNAELGINMQVAAGIYGKVDDFPGGVRIYRPGILGHGPSLTLTSLANPGHSDEFSPQLLAQWETKGTYQAIADYRFEHTKIQERDAALIWQRRGPALLLTAHIISPDHVVEANCLPGSSDESLYLQACESSIQTINVAGPLPQLKPEPGVLELEPPKPAKTKRK